jgi:Tol biopolymer transport system component
LKLAVFDSADLWIVPYPSGRAHKVFTSTDFFGDNVDWFPDSRHLVVGENSGGSLYRMVILNIADGSQQAIYVGPQGLFEPSVSPDGKRIAYTTGTLEWDVLEISLSTGSAHTMVGGGGASYFPDWASSGTHYLVSTDRSGAGHQIEDMSIDGFSRRLTETPEGSAAAQAISPRWAPDGARFVFTSEGSSARWLMLSSASGGRAVAITDLGPGESFDAWSPDGQWIAAIMGSPGKQQVVKIKASAGARPTPLPNAAPAAGTTDGVEWSPAGNWILYPSAEGMSVISPDGATVRKLSSHRFSAYAFSKNGRQAYGIFRNTTGDGARWQLYSVDMATGVEKMLTPIDLPASTNAIAGFSMHPDGKRFLTSIAKQPLNIWTIEGFAPPGSENWLTRLLRRSFLAPHNRPS